MICKKCGKALPSEGAICTFCGAMMSQEQLIERKQLSDSKSSFQANLKSDRYGVDKTNLYQEKDKAPKENKLLGAAVILFILLFLIVLVIIVNIGR